MKNGMQDLSKALKQFPKNVQLNICVGANRAAAGAIAKKAKQIVRVRTGALKRSIKVVKRKTRNKALIKHSVSAGGKVKWSVKGEKNSAAVFYAHIEEFGSSKQAPAPFMRPAFESQGIDAIKHYKAYSSKRINKEIAKAKNA